MEARRIRRQRHDGRLLKVLEAAERARETEDPVKTDRDGELLPDPAEEPTEETYPGPGQSRARKRRAGSQA